MHVLEPVLRSVLRSVLHGSTTAVLALSFPAANALYDLDFAGFQYFGGTQPEGNNTTDGRFFKQQLTSVNPSFSEETDGSLRTFTSTSSIRRTSRGLVINHDHTNIVLSPRDLTNAAWVKSASVTAAKTQTGRTKVANSASLLTFGADGTCLQAISAASLARRMYADVKQITGSDPLEMTMDGTAYTALTLNKPRYNGIGRYSLPAQTLATYSAGFRGKAGNSYLIDFVNADDSEYEMDVISSNTRAWRDRASAQIVDNSPLALFARDETTQVYFFEYAQRRDGGLAVSDADLQISSNPSGLIAFGCTTTNTPVYSDERLLVLNRAMVWRSPTASGACLNGGPVVTGPGFTPAGTLTHWDLGTNGSAANRIDGRITRFFTSRTIPSAAQAQAWTA
ncbi:hypothetical protein [Mesorhizobium sp. M7A.F.Ca.CA.004.02.1.1]|uniref:hypothetical protein n=1 Tax=Mesorhizobium sp. M7A.F.Ca.CA.004.02.1.1 TaxID=2496690 RepID=UPI000FCABCB5|nr:hypothetical protein [Mesorhizobium sp. M7A.F.Ca.CA.004.02.1.1]RVB05680.1 hypothetical protein EN912_02135 [Mesorhizobium sp. M7A.F.Ca.CA.004.02.1.1]